MHGFTQLTSLTGIVHEEWRPPSIIPRMFNDVAVMAMQEMGQLMNKMKSVDDDLMSANEELDAETVSSKKYSKHSALILLNLHFFEKIY